jgi:putative ABC transport system ATP-binding protein
MITTTMTSAPAAALAPQPEQAGGARRGDKPVLIRLEQLTKIYTEGEREHIVLDELNREFYRGEFVCLLGKSGSGKSTLLNLLSGIDAPTRGHVVIANGAETVRLTALSEHARTLFRRRNMGIVFQFFNLIPTLTVQENVTLPLELAGKSRDARRRAQELLDRVGLGNRLDTYPDKLSGGEQQRVAIARALAADPLLILADEPTGNLDEDTGDTVLRLLLELTRDAGKTLFMATHAPEVAAQADRVLHLAHGKLVSDRVG